MGVIIFCLVRFLSKKNNQIEFFFKKKPKPDQTDRFHFGSVFRAKTGSNRFGSVFSGFGSVWVGFFPVRFGFFGFINKKPKPNRTGRFFQNFNRFNQFFFRLFFFRFSWFNRFFGFFTLPYSWCKCFVKNILIIFIHNH